MNFILSFGRVFNPLAFNLITDVSSKIAILLFVFGLSAFHLFFIPLCAYMYVFIRPFHIPFLIHLVTL